MEFPITIESQEDFDTIVSKRLAKEREKFQRENGNEELRAQLEAANQRAATAEEAGYRRILDRDARNLLGSLGVIDAKRQDRIMRLAGMDGIPTTAEGDPDLVVLEQRFKELAKDTPEAFPAGSTILQDGLDTTVATPPESNEIVSMEQVRSMTPEQVNGLWPQIQAFMNGERG